MHVHIYTHTNMYECVCVYIYIYTMDGVHTSAADLVTRRTGFLYVGHMCFVCTCTQGDYPSQGDARPARLAARCVYMLTFAMPESIMDG